MYEEGTSRNMVFTESLCAVRYSANWELTNIFRMDVGNNGLMCSSFTQSIIRLLSKLKDSTVQCININYIENLNSLLANIS